MLAIEDVARPYWKVKVSVADFGLATALTVAFTSTVPAACAGEITVHDVDDVQLALAAFVPPKRKTVAPLAVANPVPVTATLVPPATGPELGLTPVTVGV